MARPLGDEHEAALDRMLEERVLEPHEVEVLRDVMAGKDVSLDDLAPVREKLRGFMEPKLDELARSRAELDQLKAALAAASGKEKKKDG